MRPAPRTALLALAAAALFAPLPAAAQRHGRRHREPPAAVDPVAQLRQNEARDRFRRGGEFYQNGDWPHAIEEYRAAFEIWNNPIILFNLAQAYRSDGQLTQAVETFNRYLQEAPSLTREQRAEVEEAVREIQETRAVLSFEVEPAGATVTLNGRALGQAPIARNVEVMPGDYAVHVELANHESRDEHVTVRTHEQRLVNVRLRPVDQNARLAVSVSPSDAAIEINGEEAGRGSVTRQVRPGSFTVVVRRDGYADETQTVSVAPLRTETVSITMRPRTRPFYTRPWFWAVVGGVVAVGAGVGIAVAATSEATPVSGNGNPPFVQTVLSY
ncbi:MAG: PEGA domain-containing protein [Polyangiales bacterium]